MTQKKSVNFLICICDLLPCRRRGSRNAVMEKSGTTNSLFIMVPWRSSNQSLSRMAKTKAKTEKKNPAKNIYKYRSVQAGSGKVSASLLNLFKLIWLELFTESQPALAGTQGSREERLGFRWRDDTCLSFIIEHSGIYHLCVFPFLHVRHAELWVIMKKRGFI